MIRRSVATRPGLWSMLCLSLLLFAAGSQAAVPTMTIDELRSRLDNPDVVIVDVRIGKDWKASESKIKGAVRVEGEAMDALATTYSKDKTLVFYCA